MLPPSPVSHPPVHSVQRSSAQARCCSGVCSPFMPTRILVMTVSALAAAASGGGRGFCSGWCRRCRCCRCLPHGSRRRPAQDPHWTRPSPLPPPLAGGANWVTEGVAHSVSRSKPSYQIVQQALFCDYNSRLHKSPRNSRSSASVPHFHVHPPRVSL